MIGQAQLLEKLNAYTIATLPKTILFVGERGSGKHTIVSTLAERLNLQVINISDKTTPEEIAEYLRCPIKKIYLIDLSKLVPKQQNQFLKLTEEPGLNMYIMLIAESEASVLTTIQNRCLKLHMEPYSVAELKRFQIFPDESLYQICTTPGQLKAIDYLQLPNLKTVANKLVTSLNKATYSNALSVCSQINYKEDYCKFDFELFLRMVEYEAKEDYIKTNSAKSYAIYKTVNTRKQEFVDKLLQKESFMLNLITKLWEITQ